VQIVGQRTEGGICDNLHTFIVAKSWENYWNI